MITTAEIATSTALTQHFEPVLFSEKRRPVQTDRFFYNT